MVLFFVGLFGLGVDIISDLDGKFRQFLSEHFRDIITVAFFTLAIFLVGKLFNSCIIPPPS